jgi:uncharacterized membrane protein (DUF2068 family)
VSESSRSWGRRGERYELISCSFQGHELVGTNAAELRPQDEVFAREIDGVRWYRCLRCDSWQTSPPPIHATARFPPDRDQIALPLRGRPLRDRYVLRLIALDRTVRVAVLAPLTTVIFLFARHRDELRHDYTKVLAALQTASGNPVNDFATSELSKLFALSTTKLYLAGFGLALFTVVLACEGVGLWLAKRWAEYLTFVETSVFVPFEIYELTHSVSALKVLALVNNLAVVSYLLIKKRLFGVRGGAKADRRERDQDEGWSVFDRTAPADAQSDIAVDGMT